MANSHGKGASFGIDNAGGSSYVSIGDLTDIDISLDQDLAEITNKSGSGWKEYLVGHKGATISGEFIWDDGGASQNAGQEDIMDAWENGTTFTWQYKAETASGAEVYTGSGMIQNVTPSSPNTDGNKASFTIQVTGAITRGTQ